MVMAGEIGLGTMFVILLLIILAIFFFLYFLGVPKMKFIFWIYLICLLIVLIILSKVPYDRGEIREESNPHFWKLCFFGLFIFIGLAVSVVFYVMVVLRYQDLAGRVIDK